MVINDLNLVGVDVFPDENDPPLLVDPNAVKFTQIAGQFFKSIARRNAQVIQFGCRMELIKFHFRTGLYF